MSKYFFLAYRSFLIICLLVLSLTVFDLSGVQHITHRHLCLQRGCMNAAGIALLPYVMIPRNDVGISSMFCGIFLNTIAAQTSSGNVECEYSNQ